MFDALTVDATIMSSLVDKSYECEAAYDRVELLLARVDELEKTNKFLMNVLEATVESYEDELEDLADVECMMVDAMADVVKYIDQMSESTTPPGFVYEVASILEETLTTAGYDLV